MKYSNSSATHHLKMIAVCVQLTDKEHAVMMAQDELRLASDELCIVKQERDNLASSQVTAGD